MLLETKFSDLALTIDLEAIKHNYKLLSSYATSSICSAVVKANAYGLGVAPVSNALYSAGCRNFFVATLDEAIELASILPPDSSIYVFHGVKPGEEKEFFNNNIIPVLNDNYQLELWALLAKENAIKLPAILHFDTGMNRLGFNFEDVEKVKTSEHLKNLDIKFIMSHMACVTLPDHGLNQLQLERAQNINRIFKGIPFSLANSKGIVIDKSYHFDMVRPGSGLYGIRGSCRDLPLKHVVTAKAKIIQVREIKTGGTVGYGGISEVKKGMRIAIAPLGYADGYTRILTGKTHAFFNGQKIPLLGRVSMDMTIFDISAIPESQIKIGSEMEMIGSNYTVDEIAANAGTIGYEILTNLGRRYRRVYI